MRDVCVRYVTDMMRDGETPGPPGPSPDSSEIVPDTLEAITRPAVLSFFAADHVDVSGNKLYVNGGFFNLLRFRTFPATLGTLGIGVALQIPFHYTMQDHLIRIGFRGPDEQELPLRVEARFRTTPGPEAEFGEPHIMPFGATIPSVHIPVPGVYHLVLWLDNQQISTYRIRAIQIPAAASPGTAAGGGSPRS